MPQFGPGTVKFGTGGTVDFAAEVTGGAITHAYDDVERKATLADTSKPAARKVAAGDTLRLDMVSDLTDSGYYAYAFTNHLTDVQVEYTPNTAAAAKWSGTVTILKPDEIGAEAWGDDIEASVELPFVGLATFTPKATTPLAVDDLEALA